MASAQDLRKRIKSVKNTQQITKAMKMVASARLHKAQQRAESTTPYAKHLREMIQHVVASPDTVMGPLGEKREVKKTGYLIIGADKGLAGAYTSNLMKAVFAEIADKNKDSIFFITAGRKPYELLRHRGYEVQKAFAGFSDKPHYVEAQQITEEAVRLFLAEEVDEIIMFYTYFINSLTYEVKQQHLLPIEPEIDEAAVQNTEYIFVPNQQAILEQLVPKAVNFSVYDALLQSAASELGSRMTAMTTATDNAGELIGHLDLEYNRLRQAQITNEISEIIGGANALQ